MGKCEDDGNSNINNLNPYGHGTYDSYPAKIERE